MSKEKKTIDIVNEIKSDLAKYRQSRESNWNDEEEAYFGKIWKNTPEFKPFENHVFQVIESEVPLLSDSQPGVSIKVTEPDLMPQAKNLEKSIQWVLEQQNFQIKYPSVVRKSLISAPSYLYTYYDANAKNGEGEIKIDCLDWKNVWLSGNSEFIEDCEKARIELKRSKTWLKLNYKNFKKEIDNEKPDYESKSSTDNQIERFDSSEYAKRDVPASYRDSDTLTLVKTYVRDYSIEKIPEEDTLEDLEKEAQALSEGMAPDINKWEDHKAHIEAHLQEMTEIFAQVDLSIDAGREVFEQTIEAIMQENPESDLGELIFEVELLDNHMEEHSILLEENPESGRLKYPNGLRLIETLGKNIFYDGPSIDEHNEIPLVPYYAYKDGTIYGFGEVRNIIDSQRMQAELQYKEYKGLRKVANPGLIIDEETGLDADDVTNEDGAVYVIPQGTSIRHLQPGSVSPQIGQFNNARQSAMYDISGINEATQGKMPSPNAAAATVERINQQAIGRIRLKDRQNNRYSNKRLYKLTGSNVIQYWTDEKVLYMENVGDDYSQVIFNPIEMNDLEYEVEISEGSMAGIDKDSYDAKLLQFLSMGAITFEDYLDFADMPKSKQIKTRVQERNDTQSQLQELQQQNILLKGQLDPSSLTEEEAAIFDQLQSEQQRAPNQGQA